MLLGFILLLVGFMKTLRASIKHKFFNSKFTKIVRLIQEFSYTLILSFIFLFYLDKEYSTLIGDKTKYNLVLTIMIVVVLNLLMEVVVVIKEIITTCREKCKKRKKLNQVMPEPA